MSRQKGNYRKRAPGHAADHPDWFISHSGGVDSSAAAIVAIDAIRSSDQDGNFAKAPTGVYLDTRTGTALNRLYVEQFFDWLDVILSTWRTHEKFEDWLRRDGAPAAGAHQEVRNELKDRQVSKLTTIADKPFYVLGIAADESDIRAEYPKVREMDRHVEVYPVHRLTRRERVEIILLSGCPINPLWIYPEVIRDCGCLCHGDPSELDKTAELFPEYGQRLREWQEAITHDFPKDTLGWGGLSAEEERLREKGMEQSTLPMCGVSCGRERDPAEVRAFKAVAEGKSRQEAVSILNESPATEAVA